MSATAESVKALDNQSTSAKGESPLMYARQGGTHPDAEKKGMSDAWEWAHKKAPSGVEESWPAWKKTEHTGVHAEMLIVRAWMVQIVIDGKHTIAEAMAMLKGRTITASQPACWCCAAFMKHYGIVFPDEGKSNKPLTGWRHPLAAPGNTISNDQMRDFSLGKVTIEQLNTLSGL